MRYNPKEIRDIPKIGLPTVSVGKVPMVSAFGVTDRAYIIEETDEPYLLWENGSAMSWEDGTNVLLEKQLVKVWQRARK